jgi:hypothetical protein
MRLPTLSPRQKALEDARELHERLFKGYMGDRDVVVRCAPEECSELARNLSWRLHRFWYDRGYTLHAQKLRDDTGVRVWLTKWSEERKAEQVA